MVLGSQIIFIILSAIGLLGFFVPILTRRCPRCVNFSCPLNRAPKKVVDAFLKRNAVMRKAWEEKGYVITS